MNNPGSITGEGLPSTPGELTEGDIFYTQNDNQYHLYKLLVFEKEMDCYHVLNYATLDTVPQAEQIDEYKINIYHFPLSREGFTNPVFLTHRKVIAADLAGYHVYLQQTCDIEEYIPLAKAYYLEGIKLSDEKKYAEAIDAYSKGIDLIPQFYEAMINRSFCYMDLARWDEAIEGFERSLRVYPDNIVAVFSIGECYFRSGDYAKAKVQFEKAHALEPDHEAPKVFLMRIERLEGI